MTGASRLIGDVFTNKIQITKIDAPTQSNGTLYGPGNNGQVLMSNGTSTYWGGLTTGVSGVKGNSESAYRTGQVNITAANIGLGNVENKSSATIRGELTSSNVTTALGYTPYNSTNPNGYTKNTGTVTSVQVQASDPLQSSTNTAQSTTLNTTISLKNQNANKILAGPSSGSAAAPTFRSLVAADIPNLSWNKITSDKPTTLSGYGITDAKIASGVITLGSNTITPLTSSSTLNATKLSGTIPTSCYTNTWDALSTSQAGYVSQAPNSTIKFLRGDATWAQVSEASLTWGGRNFAGDYGCIDAAMVDTLGANRLMFLKPEGITIEYSRDNGSTWTDYGATNSQKRGLFAAGSTFVIGKADSTNKATANGTNYQLRVTIDTGAASIYTVLNKFVIYISTNGSSNCTVTIQKALQNSPTSYTTVVENIGITGWSGYNVINVPGITTYGNTPASQYGRLRFIFKANGGSTSYNGLNITQIMGFGGVGWTVPSTMAKTGHLYSYDNDLNATFPAKVTATSFSGPLAGNVTGNVSGSSSSCTGNAATATKLATARNINGTSFDGSANITTANWGTARNISISDSDGTNTGTAVSVNGSTAVTLKLPATIKASLNGNAATATALTSDAGSSSLPIYFTGGKPSAISNVSLVATNTDSKFVNVGNSNGQIALLASAKRGVYDTTNSKWIVYIAQAADHTYIPLWGSKGSSTQPVYFNSSGEPVACTSYANASVNYATSAGSATNDSDGNAINSTYLKLSGGTMTGPIKFPTEASAYINGIRFLNGTEERGSIGVDDNGIVGIFGSTKISLRPVLNTWTDGVEITTSSMIPTKNNAVSLGTSSKEWSNVYATTFHGALDGNAATATKATKDSSGVVIKDTYVKKSGDTMTGNLTLNKITGSSANYGDTLPATGTEGQIFFKTGSVETKVDTFYPVGSIYMSVNSTNPGGLFGGTWERIQNCFLLAAGSNYAAGSTGGEVTHTLTTNEMPRHVHTYLGDFTSGGGTIQGEAWALSMSQNSGDSIGTWAFGTDDGATGFGYEGNSQPHNNMPPYLAVYVWKRTA